ncbi:MAG TPA: SDR family oxidoreductase [Chloroflexi bacterium]|nr:SDR family oxidoreductase [Chloroflexota bacterium]
MSLALVTGGAGFIGSHIVRALLAEGWQVRVLDDFSSGKRENLAGLTPARLEVQEGDLRDPLALRAALRGVVVVFHEAAFVSVPASMEDPLTCHEINDVGTARLLEAARQAGVARVVLASSAAVYGDSTAFPLREDQPPRPLSPYAATKAANELYARLYTAAFDLPVTALRYFNVYGPRQRPDSPYAAAIPIFARRMLAGQPPTIFGDGGQRRDFVFVGDVAQANLRAAESEAAAGETINICTGHEVTLLELLATLQELIPDAPAPVFASPRPGDIYRSVGDPTKAARLLGFRPQTSLREGLAEVVAWMRTTA